MIPPLRPLAAWLAIIVLATGCAPSNTPEDHSPPSEAGAPVEAGAPEEPLVPAVPSLGTAADQLDATVVQFDPADDDDPAAVARVDARVADDDLTRARGLMGVEELPDGAGMLFAYPSERTGGFWMKDTLVPLDIAFLGADGTVRAILSMEPCRADPCTVYDPEVDYRFALEVPAGWFAANGIDVGARAVWPEPASADVVEQ